MTIFFTNFASILKVKMINSHPTWKLWFPSSMTENFLSVWKLYFISASPTQRLIHFQHIFFLFLITNTKLSLNDLHCKSLCLKQINTSKSLFLRRQSENSQLSIILGHQCKSWTQINFWLAEITDRGNHKVILSLLEVLHCLWHVTNFSWPSHKRILDKRSGRKFMEKTTSWR